MDETLIYNIIKWILIVFAAGFVGYFGKYLSKSIIAKFRKKEEAEKKQIIIHKHESADKYRAKIEKQRLKLEKKKLKLMKKNYGKKKYKK
ncbi:hypothetical protein KY347_06135 [Candidatus Woesearchaeota archaeon]|nr:hypothetical protein [Candidatus Woesearchaeota archaeon]